jgi:pimeloyl-ACP methyl ester carboxylesterase
VRRATHRIPGLRATEHEFSVPLDHDRPDGEQLTVFARELAAAGGADAGRPWLLFLQGGPGGEGPRPTAVAPVWVPRAVRDYRVLLLDQRGTGLSSPVNHETLARVGSPEEQAAYLTHFRADSIVRDAELIRRELAGDEPWSVLGQSFGGFCALTYLSFFPDGLREVIVTGGLPPLELSADDVYRATYRRVLDRNRRYYERYPEDADRVRGIVERLDADDVRLPGGGRLTARRFRQLGIVLGMSDGAEQVHYVVERAFAEGARPGYGFLRAVEAAQTFETSPIYAILHEPLYCQGEASRWSAHRVAAEFAELGDPTMFTGEMVYPWMFEDYADLRPLAAAAELLADHAEWPPLYDTAALRGNDVPCAAAIYADDMYVERRFSEETVAAVPGLRAWITNEYEHDALRKHGDAVLDRLLRLVRGQL